MASFGHELSIDLAASPAAVWAVIADYERDPDWREGVRMVVEPRGEVRDGTTTREQLRMLGSWHHTTARIRDVEPGRRFRFVSEDGRIDGHDTPDIVFTVDEVEGQASGRIEAISGDDGHLLFATPSWDQSDPLVPWYPLYNLKVATRRPDGHRGHRPR